jgi:hypothetical protein
MTLHRSVSLFAAAAFAAAIAFTSSLPLHASGPTEVSGILDTDTTWTAANSPYLATGNIMVSSGATLTVEPGVTVRFTPGRRLQVQGTLIARGTAAAPILFTSSNDNPSPSDWDGIQFLAGANSSVMDADCTYLGGSGLRYVTVEYADTGVRVDGDYDDPVSM